MSKEMDDRFSPEPPPAAPKRGWLPTCLIGCLVLGLIGVCLCAGAGVWVARHAKTLGTELVRTALVNGINQSELPAEEKQAIIVQVDRVAEDFKSGRITGEEMKRILEQLQESPLMGALILYGIEQKYLDTSGLSADEKAAARQTLQRVLRGVYEQRLREPDLEPALNHVTTRAADGHRQLKDRVTDQELRAFLAACKDAVDKAKLPDEPYTVKAAEEFRKAIDRALNRGTPADLPAEAETP